MSQAAGINRGVINTETEHGCGPIAIGDHAGRIAHQLSIRRAPCRIGEHRRIGAVQSAR